MNRVMLDHKHLNMLPIHCPLSHDHRWQAVRRTGRAERIQDRLPGIRADFKRLCLPDIRNSAKPAIIVTSPATHNTKRSEASLPNECVCGAQDSCACAAHMLANNPE